MSFNKKRSISTALRKGKKMKSKKRNTLKKYVKNEPRKFQNIPSFVGLLDPELKHISFTRGLNNVGVNPNLTDSVANPANDICLSSITRGSGPDQREGQQATLKSLFVTGAIKVQHSVFPVPAPTGLFPPVLVGYGLRYIR
jgi:hypothetical protein